MQHTKSREDEKKDFFIFATLNFTIMNKRKFLFFGLHILFSTFLIYWFYTSSFIRPYAILHPYKEIICALMVLLTIYLNYFILTPKYLVKKYSFKSYVFLSILLTGACSIIELLLVKTDILRCLGNNDSFDTNTYLFDVLFLIFLRYAGFYLFFTILRLYLQTKANALLEKKEALKDTGLVLLLPLRGTPISININFVSYFSQKKNNTFIHNTIGKPTPVYSSLTSIQSYLEDYCLRINKDIIITFTNIINYNEKTVTVKEGKTTAKQSFIFYKKRANNILLTLRKKVPELEEKNDVYPIKKQPVIVNDDKKNKPVNVKALILEELLHHPSINALKLTDILEEKTKVKISVRTIRRRLKELKDAGKIEYKGSDKTGGYYAIS
jgi:DNA-binding transcriptional ArsR family regulator